MSHRREEVCCTVCSRWVAGRVPYRGDGSALKPYPHKNPDGEWCVGRIYSTAELKDMRSVWV